MQFIKPFFRTYQQHIDKRRGEPRVLQQKSVTTTTKAVKLNRTPPDHMLIQRSRFRQNSSTPLTDTIVEKIKSKKSKIFRQREKPSADTAEPLVVTAEEWLAKNCDVDRLYQNPFYLSISDERKLVAFIKQFRPQNAMACLLNPLSGSQDTQSVKMEFSSSEKFNRSKTSLANTLFHIDLKNYEENNSKKSSGMKRKFDVTFEQDYNEFVSPAKKLKLDLTTALGILQTRQQFEQSVCNFIRSCRAESDLGKPDFFEKLSIKP